MFSYNALDSISAHEYTSLGDFAVGECEDNSVRVLFDLCKTFAELHALYRYEACHYVKQRPPVSLKYVRCARILMASKRATHRFAVKVRVTPSRVATPWLVLSFEDNQPGLCLRNAVV